MIKSNSSSGNSFCHRIFLWPLIVLLSLGLFACGDEPTDEPTTYVISGTVSGDVTAGVTVTLSGAGSDTTTEISRSFSANLSHLFCEKVVTVVSKKIMQFRENGNEHV